MDTAATCPFGFACPLCGALCTSGMLFCGSEVDNTHVGALFLAAHMLPDVFWASRARKTKRAGVSEARHDGSTDGIFVEYHRDNTWLSFRAYLPKFISGSLKNIGLSGTSCFFPGREYTDCTKKRKACAQQLIDRRSVVSQIDLFKNRTPSNWGTAGVVFGDLNIRAVPRTLQV